VSDLITVYSWNPMPLKAVKRPVLTPVGDDLVFTMMNGLAIVICRVSVAYLFSRALAIGDRCISPQGLFVSFRDDIQNAASQQFDKGLKHPRVTAWPDASDV
jgi:hypothetical protein